MTPHRQEWNNDQNALLAEAFRHLSSGLVITDPRQEDNPLIYVNSGFSQLTGFDASEALGRNCRFLQGPETSEEGVRAMREAIENKVPFRGLVQNYRKDGTLFCNALIITPMFDEVGEIAHYVGTLNDVSTSREQLRALAAHATRAREAERTSIAREIHDELGQALTALKMDLAWTAKRLLQCFAPLQTPEATNSSQELQERARAMIALTENTIGTVRRIATQLRPALLDDLGLEAAAEWQVKDFAARTGIVCDFKSTLGERELAPGIATASFRILQEALTNVARHAEATRVRVRLSRKNSELHLEVRDNGSGIQPHRLVNVRSLGLLGMHERALGLGGSVEISPIKTRGTRVTARIPLKQSPQEESA
ncbi:MAG TPA: PAS domain-containing protein [Abditibacterium sp.]|jgi:PAS domain S-box-containing protein